MNHLFFTEDVEYTDAAQVWGRAVCGEDVPTTDLWRGKPDLVTYLSREGFVFCTKCVAHLDPLDLLAFSDL